MTSSTRFAASVVLLFSGLLARPIPAVQAQVNFFTPPPYAGSYTEFLADFNGDGKTDILTWDGTMNLGVGNGTFTLGKKLSGEIAAVADFNGDGKPDVLQMGNGTLLALLGNGDGTFQPPISSPSNASLGATGAADLNGDGKADVVGLFNSSLLVYLSKGDGTFAVPASYSVGFSGGIILFGDFNSDGKVDVAVVTSVYQNNVPQIKDVVFLGNGDGTLQAAKVSLGASTDLGSAIAGDFNGDGKLDLVISTAALSSNPSLVIQIGNGDGTFQAPQTIAAQTALLAAADVNGDGKLDLLVSGPVIEVYLGIGDGTFSYSYGYSSRLPNGAIAIGDFNGDGKPDIAADNVILLGNGDGTFLGWPAVVVSSGIETPVVTGDFNKDGFSDVAVISFILNPSWVLNVVLSDGKGNLTPANSYAISDAHSPPTLAAGDVNGDGNSDLVVVGQAYPSGNGFLNVFLGNGDGTFQTPLVSSFGIAYQSYASMVLGDFNNDGKLDIATAVGDQTVAIFLGNGDGTFGSPVEYFDNGAVAIVTGDFNGDGNLDIAAAGNTGLAILLGNGDGTFEPASILSSSMFGGLLAGDVNGDGKVDLLPTGAVFGQSAQVFLGNGDGTFRALSAISSIEPTALADVDGDGKLDLVGSNFIPMGHVGSGLYEGISLGNGDGTFGPFIDTFTWHAGEVFFAPGFELVADANGDGKPDLIFGDYVAPDIFVVTNTTVPGPGTLYSPTTITFPGQPVGNSSNPTPVILTNSGNAILTITSVGISGANASEFGQANNCTALQPKASCTVNVTFSPTALGGASASLMVANNADGSPQAVPLSGTGIVPSVNIGPAPGSPTSATVSAGKGATFTLVVGSTNWSGTADLSCSISPAVTPAPTCTLPASVPVNAGVNGAPVSVTVGTTARVVAGMVPPENFPLGAGIGVSTLAMFGAVLLGSGKRRLHGVALSAVMTGLVAMAACGGNGSSASMPTGGTPAGTYTATVSATAGGVTSKMDLTVVVQ